MRATISSGKAWATIMISEPTMARVTAARKMVFSANRRFKNELMGMVAATANR